MGGMIRAVVVDDEPLARDGVKLHLAREPDVRVVGEAADGRRAISLITSSGRHLLRITMARSGSIPGTSRGSTGRRW